MKAGRTALAVAVLAAALATSSCGDVAGPGRATAPTASAIAEPAPPAADPKRGGRTGCSVTPVTPAGQRAPPAWAARNGAPADTPFALAPSGRVAAFFFVYPLKQILPPNAANKILWTIRGGTRGPFRITGTAASGTHRVAATGDPGSEGNEIQRTRLKFPSTGCWRLTLSYDGTSTTLDVAVT